MTPETHRSDFNDVSDCHCSALTKTERLARARAVLEQWNTARRAKSEPLDDATRSASARPREPRAGHASGRHSDTHRVAP